MYIIDNRRYDESRNLHKISMHVVPPRHVFVARAGRHMCGKCEKLMSRHNADTIDVSVYFP